MYSRAARLLHSTILCAFGAMFASCLFDSADAPGREEAGGTGHAVISLSLEPNRHAFAKTSADTVFTLDSLIIVLTATNADTLVYRYAVSGRADTGAIHVSPRVYELACLRNWKARVYTIDESPGRRDTVHLDSILFAVLPADTVTVVKTISPAFAILRVRFLSAAADSVGSGLRYVRLRVNGETRDSVMLRGSVFRDLHFADASTGWAVADSGRIYRSQNGGATWAPQASGSVRDLKSVWFVNANTGWVAGGGGEIRKTTNGGANWFSQAGAVQTDLHRVLFASTSTGFAVGQGGTILKSLNGGEYWYSVSGHWYHLTGGPSSGLRALAFTSVSTGYAVGDAGYIGKTSDAGQSWTALASGVPQGLRGAFFVNANEGYVVGASGRILRTTNAGASWSAQTAGTTALNGVTLVRSRTGNAFWCFLLNIGCTDNVTGLAVGNGGTVQRSANGTSWSGVASGTAQNLNAIQAFDVDGSSVNFRAWAVGDAGVILTSTDRGQSWTTQVSGTAQNLHAIHCQSMDVCWVAGGGGVIRKTTNGGSTWTGQTSGTAQTLRYIHFLNMNLGYAAGDGGILLRTTDGGSNWSSQVSGTTRALYAVIAGDADTAYAAGAEGTLLKTRRAGEGITGKSLYDIYFSGNDGYAVGEDGLTLRTRDAGESWSPITGATRTLRGVFISPSGNNVYAVGDGGHFRYMPNPGGHTAWTEGSSGTTRNLRSVWVSNDRLYAVGDSGTVRTATTYGNLSASLDPKTDEDLLGVRCLGTGNTCWIGGANETVTSTSGGTSWSVRTSGARLFDQLLVWKYLRPGTPNSIVLQAIDRQSPLRGYQAGFSLSVGAGQDSTLHAPLTRCGYGGATPACLP